MTQADTAKHDGSPKNINFNKLFKGKFYGVLRWHQLDHIWDIIKSDSYEGWYVYEVNKAIPTKTITKKDLSIKIDLIDKYLRDEHDEEYCGIVYADSLESPEFIKVFDPKSLGTSCSIAKTPPLPKWVISIVQPEDLSTKDDKANKPKRWLGNLFAK